MDEEVIYSIKDEIEMPHVRRRTQRNYAQKLDTAQVKEIKRMLGQGLVSQIYIATKFNVSNSCISDIACGYTWKHTY